MIPPPRKSQQPRAEYESSRPTRTRKVKRSTGDADRPVMKAGAALREQARHLAENHDLVLGILNTLVNNTVGPNGIQIEPTPRTRSGEIHAELAEQIEELLTDWSLRPEVTWEYDRAQMERMAAMSLYRDGEFFAQHVSGKIDSLTHGTLVPYSLELLEADMVPLATRDSIAENVFSGVVKNGWGRPIAYEVYRQHPGSVKAFDARTKRVAADRMLHARMASRIGQTRGVTVLAPVLTRLHDLKDYEESERIAARISAAVAFQIKKGSPDQYAALPNSGADDDERTFAMAPGIVFDNLAVGEEISDVSSSRPSQLLQPFRDAMLRAAAAGTSTGYSTIAKDYSGTYSAQRQELVEQFVHYSTLTANFVAQFTRPFWERFLMAAMNSGLIVIPNDVNPMTVFDAQFRGPVMPWIDPVKEANANLTMVQAGFKSQSQVIRERGANPRAVMAEIARERGKAEQLGLDFTAFENSDNGGQNDAETDDSAGEGAGGGAEGGAGGQQSGARRVVHLR